MDKIKFRMWGNQYGLVTPTLYTNPVLAVYRNYIFSIKQGPFGITRVLMIREFNSKNTLFPEIELLPAKGLNTERYVSDAFLLSYRINTCAGLELDFFVRITKRMYDGMTIGKSWSNMLHLFTPKAVTMTTLELSCPELKGHPAITVRKCLLSK